MRGRLQKWGLVILVSVILLAGVAMGQSLKPKHKVNDPQLDSMIRDLYDRVGRLEPEVKRQREQIPKLEASIAALSRGLSSEVYPQSAPYPTPGEAVHFDSLTKTICRADPYYFNNVIGMLGFNGQVITKGVFNNHPMPGLVGGSPVFIIDTAGDILSHTIRDTTWGLRTTSYYAISQSFTTTQISVLEGINIYAYKTGTPAGNMYVELRSDDGTGKPSSTILAISTPLVIDEMETTAGGVGQQNYFMFTSRPKLAANTVYHLCLQTDYTAVDDANNVLIEGESVGTYPTGKACSSDSSDVWSDLGSSDLYFNIWLLIPMDPSNHYNLREAVPAWPLALGRRVWRIGTSLATTSVNIDVRELDVKVAFQDLAKTITATSSTYVSVSYGTINLDTYDMISIHFKPVTGAGTGTTYVRAYLNGQLLGSSSQMLTAFSQGQFSYGSFTTSAYILPGGNLLSFQIRNTLGNQVDVGQVTIIGVRF